MLLLVLAPQASAQRLDSKLKKAIRSLAQDWFEARPATYFEEWDGGVRSQLLERAREIEIQDASLEQIVELLWKEVAKQAPKWREELPTPYGEARWIQEGKGGSKAGLVLGLHGGGEGAGDASEAASNWPVKGHLAMYPQGIRLVHDTWNTVHGERFLLSLIEYAKARHDVDPDRVYSVGFSMGGTGSWFMVGRHPDLLAGAIPGNGVIMADPRSQLATKAEVRALQHGLLPNVRNVAVYFYTGTEDRNCMPGTFLYAWDVIEKLRAADRGGYENVRFLLHDGLAHAFAPGEPEKGIEWITDQRREPYPEKLVWEYATDPFPQRSPDDHVSRLAKKWYYWLHCSEPVDGMRVTAARDGNNFELDIRGASASTFALLLNPAMIDASRPVVVRLGGKEIFSGTVPRAFETILSTLDARIDRRLVFDRRLQLP